SILPSGVSALLARRNPDGGFGESPSTPYATALALEVLVEARLPQGDLDPSIAWLQSAQLVDGSWDGSPYQTALALGALTGGVAPNLVVPADGLVLAPAEPNEGDVVQVTARIQNTGRGATTPSRVRLFDGDPSAQDAVADAPLPALGPLDETTV